MLVAVPEVKASEKLVPSHDVNNQHLVRLFLKLAGSGGFQLFPVTAASL